MAATAGPPPRPPPLQPLPLPNYGKLLLLQASAGFVCQNTGVQSKEVSDFELAAIVGQDRLLKSPYQHIISLDRVSLKQKVVDAPEILTIIGKIPHLSEFLNSLYECQYKSFFSAFAGLTEQIKLDRYLHSHFSGF